MPRSNRERKPCPTCGRALPPPPPKRAAIRVQLLTALEKGPAQASELLRRIGGEQTQPRRSEAYRVLQSLEHAKLVEVISFTPARINRYNVVWALRKPRSETPRDTGEMLSTESAPTVANPVRGGSQ